MSQNGRSVLVTLDRERHLRFDINSLADLEQVQGRTLGEIMAGGIGLDVTRALLWAGLKHEDARLTVRGAGDLIQSFHEGGGDLTTIGEAIRGALEAAGFDGKDKAEVSEASAPFASATGSSASSP